MSAGNGVDCIIYYYCYANPPDQVNIIVLMIIVIMQKSYAMSRSRFFNLFVKSGTDRDFSSLALPCTSLLLGDSFRGGATCISVRN